MENDHHVFSLVPRISSTSAVGLVPWKIPRLISTSFQIKYGVPSHPAVIKVYLSAERLTYTAKLLGEVLQLSLTSALKIKELTVLWLSGVHWWLMMQSPCEWETVHSTAHHIKPSATCFRRQKEVKAILSRSIATKISYSWSHFSWRFPSNFSPCLIHFWHRIFWCYLTPPWVYSKLGALAPQGAARYLDVLKMLFYISDPLKNLNKV
jgi:hypothetical protein